MPHLHDTYAAPSLSDWSRRWGRVFGQRTHGPVERPDIFGGAIAWSDVVSAAASPAGAARLDYLRTASAEWDWYL
jgi:hypothetical protein